MELFDNKGSILMKLVNKIIYIICSVCLLLISVNSIYALLISKS